MRGFKSFLIFWSFVFGILFFLAPTFSWACATISKNSSHRPPASKKTAKHSHPSKKIASASRKQSHSLARNGRKVIPPTRVRVIDTGSKTDSDAFPMSETISADTSKPASGSKSFDRSAAVSDDTFETDSFDTLEAN